MAYYDRIAKKWHYITGYQGGVFKKLVLNDFLLNIISTVSGLSILELGAGNGYFLPLALRRFSGQIPSRVVITDLSQSLLTIAQRYFRVPNAEYMLLDVRAKFPFPDEAFNLILATMVFNEVSTAGVRKALSECHRVLSGAGSLVMTVTHPSFIKSLSERGLLSRDAKGTLTMPGVDGLRLPVVKRSERKYKLLLKEVGFSYYDNNVSATREVLNLKPGLRKTGGVPLALVFNCTKDHSGKEL